MGMLGTCYLIKNAIESNNVAEIFRLGPNYLSLPEIQPLAPDNLVFGCVDLVSSAMICNAS